MCRTQLIKDFLSFSSYSLNCTLFSLLASSHSKSEIAEKESMAESSSSSITTRYASRRNDHPTHPPTATQTPNQARSLARSDLPLTRSRLPGGEGEIQPRERLDGIHPDFHLGDPKKKSVFGKSEIEAN